jgi:hypothetical protein
MQSGEFGLQVRLPQTFRFIDWHNSKLDCDAGVKHSNRSADKKMMMFRCLSRIREIHVGVRSAELIGSGGFQIN